MLAMVAFGSAAAYLTRHCISAANTAIQADLRFDDAQMGQLMSAFAIGYLLCQVPAGWLGNRWGTRLAFTLLSILWSLSNLWTAVGSTFHLLWASRFSLGSFQAGLVPVSAKIVRDWMPARTHGISSAAITAAMSVGGAFAMWLTGRLLDGELGWRTLFAAYSLLGVAWSIGFCCYFRTFPRDHPQVNDAERNLIDANRQDRSSLDRSAAPSKGPSLVLLLTNTSMWGICGQAFFRAAGYGFFVTWFFAFLEYAYGISKAEAGALNSLPLAGMVIGSLSGGLLVDGILRATNSRWLSRTGTALVSLTFSGLLTAVSAWTGSAAQLSIVIALGTLFSGLGAPAAWAATIDIGGRQTAVVMGVMNMAGCLAAVILPTLLGTWFGQIRESGGDWAPVIYLHAGFYFAGAICWLFVNPNHAVDPSASMSAQRT